MCTGSHPFIPVSGVAKIEMIYEQDEQMVVNVFHVRSAGGWDASGLMAKADAMAGWFEGTLAPNYPVEYCLKSIKVTDLSTSTGAVAIREYSPPTFGEEATDSPLPNNVTLAVKWNTALRGRSYRGRTFWPCLLIGQVAGNRLNAGAVTAITTMVNALRTAIEAGGYTMVVVSYCNNKTWRTTGVATPITTFAINEVVDSQRRRLPERGR
jgi:hypothetical protein